MKILLAIDPRAYSAEMVSEIGRRRWPARSELRLLTVDLPVRPATRWGESYTAFDEFVRRERAEAYRYLDAAAAIVKEIAPDLIVTTILREGYPKDEIVKEANRWGANLIIVGTRGLGPIRRFFQGSISLAVATNAPCSVEIYRTSSSRRQHARSRRTRLSSDGRTQNQNDRRSAVGGLTTWHQLSDSRSGRRGDSSSLRNGSIC